jgi:hypothetical protein
MGQSVHRTVGYRGLVFVVGGSNNQHRTTLEERLLRETPTITQRISYVYCGWAACRCILRIVMGWTEWCVKY